MLFRSNFIYDIQDALTPGEKLPLQAWALKTAQERQSKDDPEALCLPTGVPRRDPYPTKIIQTDKVVVILYEGNIHSFRQIFMDGRPHPEDPDPTWWGHSIGHWEKDTFVVESNGFNDKTWIDAIGHPHGEKLRLTERYHRRDFGHIELQLTVNDPDWYEKPWSVTLLLEMTPDNELLEDVCLENERDWVHMK